MASGPKRASLGPNGCCELQTQAFGPVPLHLTSALTHGGGGGGTPTHRPLQETPPPAEACCPGGVPYSPGPRIPVTLGGTVKCPPRSMALCRHGRSSPGSRTFLNFKNGNCCAPRHSVCQLPAVEHPRTSVDCQPPAANREASAANRPPPNRGLRVEKREKGKHAVPRVHPCPRGRSRPVLRSIPSFGTQIGISLNWVVVSILTLNSSLQSYEHVSVPCGVVLVSMFQQAAGAANWGEGGSGDGERKREQDIGGSDGGSAGAERIRVDGHTNASADRREYSER